MLDTSVLIGLLDQDDVLHAASARAVEVEVAKHQRLAISAVTWSELLTGGGLLRGNTALEHEFISDAGVLILNADRAVAERAAELKVAYMKKRGGRLKTPDALILATGSVYPGIDRVLVADAQWAKIPAIGVTLKLITR